MASDVWLVKVNRKDLLLLIYFDAKENTAQGRVILKFSFGRKEKATEKERRAAATTEAGEKGRTHPRAGKPQVSIAAAVRLRQ
ncbi:hypothetical protein FK519_28425 [Klebsiella pneumoniae]|nr:hypothetical protein [Klebsiella pneumoniae]